MASSSESSDSESEEDVPSPSQDTSGYLAYLQKRIQPLTRHAAQLPGPSDLSFHKSLDRSLLRDLDAVKDDITGTINALLNCTSSRNKVGKAKIRDEAGWKLAASDLTDEGSFARSLGDVIDNLLEKADVALDESQRVASPSEKPRKQQEMIPALGPLPSHLLNANIQPLPQSKFRKRPDNSRDVAWKHSLDVKPFAKVPLSWTVPPPGPDDPIRKTGVRQGMYCAEGDPQDNPYYYEIHQYHPPAYTTDIPEADQLTAPPPLQKDEPTSGPIPFLWVNDANSFQQLYDHLKADEVKEVAIDVEHHNYRSFQGLVCLVQISTRWHDFIVDAISPQIRDISHRLNDIFADPNKVKILHGAEHDILWLQRDLNLYIVGLFDTYHATNVLNFPQHSLAFLLSRYVQFEADKRYQMADWRIRPLEKEMMFYARSDTHSLIYIYDCLRFEIWKREGKEAVKKVFELSKRTACKTFAKEEWDDGGDTREGWKTVWKRVGGEDAFGVDERWSQGGVSNLNKTERIFRALHDWRDQVARAEDESPRYILPSNILLNLSSRAPSTSDEVMPCVGPAFKKRSKDIAQLIKKETQAFEKTQAQRADRERSLLNGAANNEVDEEMGEVITRDAIVQSSLWPATCEDAIMTNGKSAIASFLFANSDEPARSSKLIPKTSSLFTPVTESTLSNKVKKTIEAEMTSALRGILDDTNSINQSNDIQEALQPETVPFVAKELRAPIEESNVVSSSSRQESVALKSEDDDIVKVKKTNSQKKRNGSQEQEESPRKKKPKWTKEEKAARKKENQKKVVEAITPFDYSNAKSILDLKVTPASSTNASKEKKKDKKKDHKGNSQDSQDEKGQGRYASISVRRDRREQQGGKSMSFAN